jgi:hypothetical protein
MDERTKKDRETSQVLSNLTEFISNGDRDIEEIRESVKDQGLDPDELLAHFRQILSKHAPTWREKAARARAELAKTFEAVGPKAHRSRSEIEREIRETIEAMRGLGAPVEAGAYHRKFQEARDEDLESLLDDLRLQKEWLTGQRRDDRNG